MDEPAQMQARDLIDIERYPIDRLDSVEGQALVAACRADLKARALCRLPGFIRPAALEMLAGEANPLTAYGLHRSEERTFMSYGQDVSGLPAGHPRRARHHAAYRQVMNYRIPNDSLIRRLYLWPALTEFVRQVFGARTLYQSQCPHLALTMKVEGEGDTDAWHYDPNDGVVSLLLQKADEGGEFEYAPYLRTEEDERFDQVAKVFADPTTHAQRPPVEPGTFVFFNGHLSLHRVRPVGRTRKPRIIALFSYDQEPDQVFNQRFIDHLHSFPSDAPWPKRQAPARAAE
ncbi:MAG: hypothetical protein RIE31_09010 [Alphaproteobacteria bacterium]